ERRFAALLEPAVDLLDHLADGRARHGPLLRRHLLDQVAEPLDLREADHRIEHGAPVRGEHDILGPGDHRLERILDPPAAALEPSDRRGARRGPGAAPQLVQLIELALERDVEARVLLAHHLDHARERWARLRRVVEHAVVPLVDHRSGVLEGRRLKLSDDLLRVLAGEPALALPRVARQSQRALGPEVDHEVLAPPLDQRGRLLERRADGVAGEVDHRALDHVADAPRVYHPPRLPHEPRVLVRRQRLAEPLARPFGQLPERLQHLDLLLLGEEGPHALDEAGEPRGRRGGVDHARARSLERALLAPAADEVARVLERLAHLRPLGEELLLEPAREARRGLGGRLRLAVVAGLGEPDPYELGEALALVSSGRDDVAVERAAERRQLLLERAADQRLLPRRALRPAIDDLLERVAKLVRRSRDVVCRADAHDLGHHIEVAEHAPAALVAEPYADGDAPAGRARHLPQRADDRGCDDPPAAPPARPGSGQPAGEAVGDAGLFPGRERIRWLPGVGPRGDGLGRSRAARYFGPWILRQSF